MDANILKIIIDFILKIIALFKNSNDTIDAILGSTDEDVELTEE